MKTKYEFLSDIIVSNAYSNFVKIFHPGGTDKGFFLWNFIGQKGKFKSEVAGWYFQPLQARRLRGLAGPHCKTIAKILLSQGCDPYTSLDNEK